MDSSKHPNRLEWSLMRSTSHFKIIFVSFLLVIFSANLADAQYFGRNKIQYKDYVDYALSVWKKADDRIDYSFVNTRRAADISVIFIEDLGDKYNEDYIGLTDYNIDRDKRIGYSRIQISLTKFDDEIVSDGEIKATIIHELGHAFGLGHSKNEFDIMYPYIDPEHSPTMDFNELSSGDSEAIEYESVFYRTPPYSVRAYPEEN